MYVQQKVLSYFSQHFIRLLQYTPYCLSFQKQIRFPQWLTIHILHLIKAELTAKFSRNTYFYVQTVVVAFFCQNLLLCFKMSSRTYNEGFLRSFLEPEVECKSDFYAKELIFRGKKGAKLKPNMVFKILNATHFLPNFVQTNEHIYLGNFK